MHDGPVMDLTRLTLPQRISLGAAGVVAISAFLPWVSIFGIGVSGIEGDGVITLVLALAGAALLVFVSTAEEGAGKIPPKVADIALIVIGGLIALIGLIDLNEFGAIGLYLTLLGGLVWAGCAVWQLVAKPAAAGAETGA